MHQPPAPPDYFAATEAWLLKQPGRATAGGVRKRRPVAPDLARHTANRIRRATPENPGWQPPRWRARHKLAGRIRPVAPAFHARGIAGLIEPDERLLLAHTHGDRLRLRATLAYLNARVEPGLSASCYGGRPDATRRGTDRRAALVCFRSLVRDGGLPWVAKLDIASFFDAIPHGPLLATLRGQVASRRCEREVAGYLAWYWQARWPDWPAATPLPGEPVGVPQGSPISGVLANVFLSAFDRALERAVLQQQRYRMTGPMNGWETRDSRPAQASPLTQRCSIWAARWAWRNSLLESSRESFFGRGIGKLAAWPSAAASP